MEMTVHFTCTVSTGKVAEQTIDEGKTIKIYFRKMNKNLPTHDLPSVKVAKITSDVAKITVLTTSNKYSNSNILCTSPLGCYISA